MLGLGVWSVPPTEARERQRERADISAERLPDAIAELAREARVSIGMEGALPRIRTSRLRGDMDVTEALRRLLSGTGYVAHRVGPTAWRIERAPLAATPATPDNVLPEPQPVSITVTATKQPVELLSLPAAVSVLVLTEADRAQPGSNSATVASQLEGLSLTSLGPGRNRMFLRGIADSAFSGESQSTVAVVLDEARLTFSAPDPDVRLIDIDRVEVLKGPQGSLYGTGALGGIYRLVSHPAELDETSLSILGGASVVAHGGTGKTGSVIANLPLARDTAALRLVGYGSEEPGWVDTGTRRDSNLTRLSGARVLLGLVPVDGWRLDLTGFSQWIETKDSSYVYARRSFVRPDQVPEPHDNDLRHVAGRVTGAVGDVDLTLASAGTWHEVDDTLDATVGADSFGMTDPLILRDRRAYLVWDNEARARGRFGPVGWLVGLSYIAARQTMAADLLGRSGSRLDVDDDRRTSHDTAAYVDLTLPLSSTVSIDGGARLFRSAIEETRALASGSITRELEKSGMTPSLALAWQPNPRRLIYARYGSAFRQGGSDIGANGEVKALKGDELASFEVGWRERLPGGGHAELSTWYARWDDVQSDMLDVDGLLETANVGDARIVGIEGAIDLPVSAGWRFEGGFNRTDAVLIRSTLGFSVDDRHLPVVPEYTVRAALRHDFVVAGAEMWTRLRLRYLGPARMSFDPAIDRSMGHVFESALDVHASWGGWQIAVDAQNLIGDRGNAFAFGNALRYRTMPQFTTRPPRTLSVTLTRSF